MELSLLGIRFFLGLVFVFSSLPKLTAPTDFRHALGNYRLLPFRLVAPVSAWLPRVELLLCLVLLSGGAIRVSEAVAAIALVAFSAAVGINVGRGRRIECGCFTPASPRQITWRLVVQDLALAAGAVLLVNDAPPAWVGRDTLAAFFAAAAALATAQLTTEAVRLRRTLLADVWKGGAP